uniref:Uncharacterized protein n=1 Tax=Oscillatoriales cyanobacterium SpSt-402 TaxID=2282168 RepID=A0A832H416_9CYAN
MSVPASVKVFGILHTIFGSFSAAIGLYNLFNFGNAIAVFELVGFTKTGIVWLQISSIISFVAALVLLALGIGLLAKKPWARSGAVIFGYVSIALNIFNALVIVFTFPNRESTGTLFIAGAIAGAVLQSIYPVLTIFFMSRPAVKAALAHRG